MTRHIGIAEHMQLAATIQWTVIGFAVVIVAALVAAAVIAERMDDDGNY